MESVIYACVPMCDVFFSGHGQLRDFCQRRISSQPWSRPLHLTVLLCWLVFSTQDQPPKIYRWLLKIDF